MTGVAGVDQSLKRTGLATYAGTKALELPADGRTDASRIRGMSDWILQEIADAEANRAVIEAQFSSRNKSGQVLMGLHWHIRAELDRLGIPVLIVTNDQVKIFATGKARTEARSGESEGQRRRRFKAEIVAAVEARTGLDFDGDDDQAEAMVLRCIGLELLGFSHPMGVMPVSHRRAVDGLEWPLLYGAARP